MYVPSDCGYGDAMQTGGNMKVIQNVGKIVKEEAEDYFGDNIYEEFEGAGVGNIELGNDGKTVFVPLECPMECCEEYVIPVKIEIKVEESVAIDLTDSDDEDESEEHVDMEVYETLSDAEFESDIIGEDWVYPAQIVKSEICENGTGEAREGLHEGSSNIVAEGVVKGVEASVLEDEDVGTWDITKGEGGKVLTVVKRSPKVVERKRKRVDPIKRVGTVEQDGEALLMEENYKHVVNMNYVQGDHPVAKRVRLERAIEVLKEVYDGKASWESKELTVVIDSDSEDEEEDKVIEWPQREE
jgi:hypothetical protein